MRLKKLILQGFKSFADRTEFVFDVPIVGIVGPNGCGKSNVVDAFKWVLGEQSAKSLRGEAMMDVIFNGSSARKASGMAEVVLVFDNPKRPDGTRILNIDVDEVSVGRRLFRDSTSEYQVNNQAARLKDIRELFLDTGVGVDAYSVIEQGRVAALLESNPQERRLIFEEAAGISKFKQKKKEAQRKLERVDQNLLRVTDIVEEVDKRLRSVRIQAGRARTFQEHSARLRELRLTYALQEYHSFQTQLEEHVAGEAAARTELEGIETELSEKQLGLNAMRHEHEGVSQQKQRAEYELVQARAAMESARQRQDYATQQLAQIAEQLRQFEQDQASLAEKSAQVARSLADEEQSLASLAEQVSAHRKEIEQRQQAFHDTQLQLNQINREIEQHKSAILDLMRRSAAVNNRLGAIEIERKNIAAQQQRLGQRRQVVLSEIEILEAGRRELDENLAAAQGQITAMQRQLEQSTREAAALGRQISQIAEQLGAAREHRSGLVSRQRLLQDLEAKREGLTEGVKSVLRQKSERFGFIRGLVADVLRVDVEHAHVIEAALDGRDQMLIADHAAAVEAASDELSDLEGRINILCADSLVEKPFARDLAQPRISRVPLDGIACMDLDEPPARSETWGGGCAEILEGPALPQVHVQAETPALEELETAVCALEEPADKPVPRLPDSFLLIELPQPQPLTERQLCLAERIDRDERDWYDWNQHPHRVRIAADLVRTDPCDAAIARHLLGRTIVVETLADAMQLHRAAPRGFRYVTAEGEVVENDGVIRTGPLTAAMGLISRRSELEALALQIAEVDRRIEDLSGQLSDGNAQAKALQQKQKEFQNAVYQENTKKVQLSSRIAQNTDKQSALRRELPVLDRELQNFLDQAGRLRTEEATLVEKRQAMEVDQASRQQQVEALSTKQAEGAELLKQTGEALTTLRVRLGAVQEKHIASQQAVQRFRASQNELAQQVERIARTAEQVVQRRASVEKEMQAAREAETQLQQKQEALTRGINELVAEVEKLSASVERLAAEVSAAQAEQSRIAQIIHQIEVKIGEVRVRLEGLVQRTLDELQLDLPARWAELQQQGGYQPAEMDWPAVAEEIRQLKDKIQRLGNVNLDAIAEQDDLEHRQTFLTAQVTDLTESKRQLEQLIEEINTESAARFEETFNAVREHFQGMFRKLFGGGKADIYLETELEEAVAAAAPEGATAESGELPSPRKKIDILDAGIEIIARPPGKQPVSISQLSGGEKTMTCVAMLMSIFKSKPSPFCLLDEVDAALDEANNQRFNLIIQEFLDQSQFIVITHSKRTMQIADLLYGVTMQEQGVSKKVAVKFDQVDSQGQISEHAAA